MKNRPSSTAAGTSLGIFSIFFWSTTVAVSRSMTESLGIVTTACLLFILSGILALGVALVRNRGVRYFKQFSASYLIICGGLFVMYEICLYLGLGLAVNRQQVLEVGLINYLWVPLVLLFSIPILKHRARLTLIPGIVLAFGGVTGATLYGRSYSLVQLQANLSDYLVPYLLALGCAVSWGLYSNLTRRLGGNRRVSAVPLFLIASGAVLIVPWIMAGERTVWNGKVLLELSYTAIFPTILAYTFWDRAMRTGNMVLVASLSYFVPLVSTIISSVYLGAPMGWFLWLACLLVVAGAGICKWSITDGSIIIR